MTLHWNLLIEKDRINNTSLSTETALALQQGQAEVQLQSFALTANNVTYAVLGKSLGAMASMGYWDFFPYDDQHGLLPVWGFARVSRSECAELPVDAELYGFFPLTSHWVMQPELKNGAGIVDNMSHRRSLPAVYNQYQPLQTIQNLDEEKSLWPVFRPLYVTGFMISDELIENQEFGAEQVVVGSASSKTAMLFAHCHKQTQSQSRLVGLTSTPNLSFLKETQLYDEVVSYDELANLNKDAATVFVDMAGNGDIIKQVYSHFGDELKAGVLVGKSHWSSDLDMSGLQGPKMNLFFAPEVIRQRLETWGPKILQQKLDHAWRSFVGRASELTTVVEVNGPEAAQDTYKKLVSGQVDPSVSNLVTL